LRTGYSFDNSVIPSLDGLRAVSISIVLVSHAGFGTVVPGGLGVTIFFFLSGYLITTLLWMSTNDLVGLILGSFIFAARFGCFRRLW